MDNQRIFYVFLNLKIFFEAAHQAFLAQSYLLFTDYTFPSVVYTEDNFDDLIVPVIDAIKVETEVE
jgi:hypothetical protein